MKRNIPHLFILTATSLSALWLLPALSGCDSGAEQEPLAAGVPVAFEATAQPVRTSTRADEITTANITSMGVFAAYTGQSDFNGSTPSPNYMYNQKVARANGSSPWTYTPVKYWPDKAGDKISFFAYAPYADGTADSNPAIQDKEAAVGFPTLVYTVPAAEADRIDLLAATPLMNQTPATNSGKVEFKMKHALTKVMIYVKSNDNQAGKKVTAFSIQGPNSGTLTYRTPTDGSDAGFGWTFPATTTGTFTATATDFAVPDNSSAAKSLLATFFLLPKGEGCTFSITYTYTGATSDGGVLTQPVTLTAQSLPSPDAWTPGNAVSYTLGIEKKKITVTMTANPTWNDGGTGTTDGKPAEELKPEQDGDIPDWVPDTTEDLAGKEG